MNIHDRTNEEVRSMLALLPTPKDREWDEIAMNDFEAEFLTSVRDQFSRKQRISEKQFAVLERIYRKHA